MRRGCSLQSAAGLSSQPEEHSRRAACCSCPSAAGGDLAKIKSWGVSFWFAPYLWERVRGGGAVRFKFALQRATSPLSDS